MVPFRAAAARGRRAPSYCNLHMVRAIGPPPFRGDQKGSAGIGCCKLISTSTANRHAAAASSPSRSANWPLGGSASGAVGTATWPVRREQPKRPSGQFEIPCTPVRHVPVTPPACSSGGGKPPSGQFGVGRNAALAVAWIHPPTRQVANSWFGAAVRCATNLREPRPAGCCHLQRAPGDRAVSAADTRAGSTGPDTCPQPVDAPLGAVRPRKRRYSGEDALNGRRTPYR